MRPKVVRAELNVLSNSCLEFVKILHLSPHCENLEHRSNIRCLPIACNVFIGCPARLLPPVSKSTVMTRGPPPSVSCNRSAAHMSCVAPAAASLVRLPQLTVTSVIRTTGGAAPSPLFGWVGQTGAFIGAGRVTGATRGGVRWA